MFFKFKNEKGFALLYAILLTGAVLTVGVILMNIITKQLIFSSLNRNSEVSYYYLANSGRECLRYFVNKKSTVFYKVEVSEDEEGDPINTIVFKENPQINCFVNQSGQSENISLIIDNANQQKPTYCSSQDGSTCGEVQVKDGLINRKIKLTVQFNKSCMPGGSGCGGTQLIDRAKAVMTSEGYSNEVVSGRTTKRTAVSVIYQGGS